MTSSDYGSTWTEVTGTTSGKTWSSVSMSASGQYQTGLWKLCIPFGSSEGGEIYIGSDYGNNKWTFR